MDNSLGLALPMLVRLPELLPELLLTEKSSGKFDSSWSSSSRILVPVASGPRIGSSLVCAQNLARKVPRCLIH